MVRAIDPGSGREFRGTEAGKGARRLLPLPSLLLALLLSACASTPKYFGLDSDQVHALAMQEFEAGEWTEATESLERFLLTWPTDPRAADARIRLAGVFMEREQYLSAVSEYQRFLERHAGHERSAEAALGVCLAYAELSPVVQRDQAYTETAVTECQKVALDFPGRPEAVSAEEVRDRMIDKLARKEWEVGEFYYRRGLLDSAIQSFEVVLDRFPASRSAPDALLYMWRTYRRLDWGPEAEEVRSRLATRYPESEALRTLEQEVALPPGGP